MRNFRNLLIWQKAMSLVAKTYLITHTFPKDEVFGLVAQIRRCSVSIPSNIAEGSGRETKKEFARFINIAVGSLYEFQTQLEIARNINYINETDFNNFYEDSRELEAMLTSFYRTISKV